MRLWYLSFQPWGARLPRGFGAVRDSFHAAGLKFPICSYSITVS